MDTPDGKEKHPDYRVISCAKNMFSVHLFFKSWVLGAWCVTLIDCIILMGGYHVGFE